MLIIVSCSSNASFATTTSGERVRAVLHLAIQSEWRLSKHEVTSFPIMRCTIKISVGNDDVKDAGKPIQSIA